MKSVSVVMTTYNRNELLKNTLVSIQNQCYQNLEVIVVDDGTELALETCLESGLDIQYIRREREPGTFYSNPAVPNNLGLKAATGELVILQNAECLHHENVIEKFVEQTPEDTATFGMVQALTPTGGLYMWYTHPVLNRRPFFFCGALHRKHFVDLHGFDENFLYYAMDDDQFAERMQKHGIKVRYSTDILISHQWHGSSFKPEDHARNQLNVDYYKAWKQKFDSGEVGVAVGEPWQ